MKTSIKIFAILFIIALSSCKAFDKLTQFEMDYSTNFTIPSSIGINLPFNLPLPSINAKISEKLENEQTNTKLVEHLFIKEILLETEYPNNKTFQFLKNVELYIKTDDLPAILVAHKYNIYNSIGTKLVLDIEAGQDLEAYIKQDSYTIETKVTIDELSLEAIDLRADLVFDVDAKILGI